MSTLSYETAKKLKDAGFPQWTTAPAVPYQPTLSELIEACGPAFISLVQADPGFTNKPWAAMADGFTRIGEIEGDTPEEAVAALWLALNTK